MDKTKMKISIIWDGNHRLYAAAIAGMNQIKYHIKGSEKFFKTLQEGN